MRNIFTVILLAITLTISAQSKIDYLKNNRFDMLSSGFQFPQENFKVIGFGALHGSSKTYKAELLLIKSFKSKGLIDYYIPETNFSQAFFFEKFLKTGDDELLKKLVLAFETIVSQEGSIDTYNHWKKLKKINDSLPKNKKIKVLGFDLINEYQFPIRHILDLTKNIKNWKAKENLKDLLTHNALNLSPGDSITESCLKEFIENYRQNEKKFIDEISNIESFEHILRNIEFNFEKKREREKIIYLNFVELSKRYSLKNKTLFLKYGYSHLLKFREGNYPSFFTRLIENGNYSQDEVITVMGYLTKSQVLWDKIYDDKENYKRYTIEKGYGISDYWKEYFKGIRKLKRTKLSDLTLYRISSENSPYNRNTDLVELKILFKDYNTSILKGKNTAQFIDYAILIYNSIEQMPIEELKE